jgi:hypothetical protein
MSFYTTYLDLLNDRKKKVIDNDENFLKYLKFRLLYSVGNNESFYVKLSLIVKLIQETISNSNKENLIKKIYKKIAPIVNRDFSRNDKRNDVHKIRHCITIISYELYIKNFPESQNICNDNFYQLYPHFLNYDKKEQVNLFNFYKCVVILKNIISFQRNFGFIFDLTTIIVEGKNKYYTRGGRSNLQTNNRSKIVFDVYGEVKKPSMRFKKSDDDESSDDESSDNESSDDDEYNCLKKMKIDFSLFDLRIIYNKK